MLLIVQMRGCPHSIDMHEHQVTAKGIVVCYFRGTSESVIERDVLRESDERFRTMADNISQLAWMADSDGHILRYNCPWYEYTCSMSVASGKIELRKERIELASAVHHALEVVRPNRERMNHELTLVLPPEIPLSTNSCRRQGSDGKSPPTVFDFCGANYIVRFETSLIESIPSCS